MNKRGQVTIFVIIAILVVAIVAIVIIFWTDLIPQKEDTVTREYAPLQNYMQSCLEQSLADVIYINSIQGGYYIVDGEFIVYNDNDLYVDSLVPYYLINQQLLVPSEEELENQFSYGIKEQFGECLDLSEFEYNISYDYDSIRVNSDIRENVIRVELDSSIHVNEGETSVILKNFTAEQTTSYLEYYNFAKYLAEKQKADIDTLCLSCLVKETEAREYNLYLDSVVSKDSYILINTLNNKKDDLFFGFAYKFEYEDEI